MSETELAVLAMTDERDSWLRSALTFCATLVWLLCSFTWFVIRQEFGRFARTRTAA